MSRFGDEVTMFLKAVGVELRGWMMFAIAGFGLVLILALIIALAG